jgi:ferredoxin
VCPEDALQFNFAVAGRSTDSVDLRRRALVVTIGSALVAVPIFRTGPPMARAHPSLIRPPGSLPEREFLERCVKCGECMKVCLTNGLHPTLLESGLEGIWSPKFIFRIGYCEYECTLCGQVCPTGAIRNLPVEEKKNVKIGLAFIDPARCLPFAFGVDCIVCEEHCPTPQKAIWFEETTIVDSAGNKKQTKLPRVDPELCIGCGICEYKCPVGDEPAIYVTSIGESRSEENQLLLSP